MKKIAIISDTHSYLPDRMLKFLSVCDEIWHAGDIGNYEIIEKLSMISKVRAVYGNIDDYKIRNQFSEYQFFELEKSKVLLMHIGGNPNKYSKHALELIKEFKPNLFVCGHSHILKIMYDHKNNLLYVNPGAAGKYGFHTKITAIRMDIEKSEFKNLEIFELEK